MTYFLENIIAKTNKALENIIVEINRALEKKDFSSIRGRWSKASGQNYHSCWWLECKIEILLQWEWTNFVRAISLFENFLILYN